MKLARFWFVCAFFLFWTVAITTRLFWLQIVRHSDYVERADKQQQRTFEVAPRRGVLYDRNMRELAMTVQVDSIYAVQARSTTRELRRAPSHRSFMETPRTTRPAKIRSNIASKRAEALRG
jgi:cell division protein FtsI (penicillin-binding protein 3)